MTIVTAEEPESLLGEIVGTGSDTIPIGLNIFQTLVGRDPETYALAPQLALSWKQVEPTRWQFELRPGVSFHDGTPFNAETAAAAMSYMWDPAVESAGGFVSVPATWSAVGDMTLEMVTDGVDPIVPTRLTMLPVISPTQLADDPDSRVDHPIGTGPYKFVAWDRGQEVRLELDPTSYLAAPGMFDTVKWIFRAEPDVRAGMLETGEADVTFDIDGDQCAATPRCEPTGRTEIRHVRIDDFNQTLLGDVRIRQAVAQAIDRQAINDAFLDKAPVLDNLIIPGAVGFKDDVTGYKYDPDAAKALVDAATADGVPTDLPIKVKYFIGHYPNNDAIAEVIATSLQAIGLNASVEGADRDTFLAEYILNSDTQTLAADMPKDRAIIYVSSTGNELLDLSVTAQLLLTCNGGQSVICDPALDDMYEKAITLSGDERDKAFDDMWATAYERVAILPLAQSTRNWAFSDRIDVMPGQDSVLPLWNARATG